MLVTNICSLAAWSLVLSSVMAIPTPRSSDYDIDSIGMRYQMLSKKSGESTLYYGTCTQNATLIKSSGLEEHSDPKPGQLSYKVPHPVTAACAPDARYLTFLPQYSLDIPQAPEYCQDGFSILTRRFEVSTTSVAWVKSFSPHPPPSLWIKFTNGNDRLRKFPNEPSAAGTKNIVDNNDIIIGPGQLSPGDPYKQVAFLTTKSKPKRLIAQGQPLSQLLGLPWLPAPFRLGPSPTLLAR
ncbi:hypothetical protein GGU10DRAFT_379567 [Lentinula aff. detonsa]|uniref:Uncharacterized protein n=1 Tax=Lentinula aff. detonsa TaxID=2804958 RepID=A0AA38KC98_9AGAR|nr:hypothetical protein GGU10DRAFT_379567 [Lentinula aff. detonsa]